MVSPNASTGPDGQNFVPDIAISVNTTFEFDNTTGRLWRNGGNAHGPIYSIGVVHDDHAKCGLSCVLPQEGDVVSLNLPPGFDIELTQEEMTSMDPQAVRSLIGKTAESHYRATAYHLGRIKAPEPDAHAPFQGLHLTNVGKWARKCRSLSEKHHTSLVSLDTFRLNYPSEKLYDDCFAPMKGDKLG
ncbi:hypothetical protein I302_105178 [Kwoniella bestiolae CBS 10118]|uniref:Uncharacterized protein n=1 Tax=Kwoniella bestiolae CBS 10118 TaxID=1296100 RepID=A0A1B9FSD8_9TREE|nr:hypothetical protein I302_08465 [Kwoniella bestiolae CBS 10118]OCF21688.1 hypothetical protein I302_08465 [Kwoniella bestiolae CBS 10118]